MKINIEPRKPSYDAIMQILEKSGVNSQEAIKGAINDTSKYLKDQLHTAVRVTYSIKASQFRKADIIKKNATNNHLEATITVNGTTPSLYEAYKFYKNTKHIAVRAVVKQGGGKKALQLKGGDYKAFIATMSNGHTAIFQRKSGTQMKKSTKSRERIKQISAMSRAKAAEVTFREQLQEDADDKLNRMLHTHMYRVLEGK